MTSFPLDERSILVVEDEYIFAMELRRELKSRGARVIGPVPSVDLALEMIDTIRSLDAVVLDVNLQGEISSPVADTLSERGIPFVFATAYVDGGLPTRFPKVPRCEKPFEFRELEDALASVLRPAHADPPSTR